MAAVDLEPLGERHARLRETERACDRGQAAALAAQSAAGAGAVALAVAARPEAMLLGFGMGGLVYGAAAGLRTSADTWGARGRLFIARVRYATLGLVGLVLLVTPEVGDPGVLVLSLFAQIALVALAGDRGLAATSRFHAGFIVACALGYAPREGALAAGLYVIALSLDLAVAAAWREARLAVPPPVAPLAQAMRRGLLVGGALAAVAGGLAALLPVTPVRLRGLSALAERGPIRREVDLSTIPLRALLEALVALGAVVGLLLAYHIIVTRLRRQAPPLREEDGEPGAMAVGARTGLGAPGPVPPTERGPRADAVRVYLAYERELARLGLERGPAAGPAEHAERAAAGRGRRAARALRAVAGLFGRLRWGPAEVGRAEVDALRDLTVESVEGLREERACEKPDRA